MSAAYERALRVLDGHDRQHTCEPPTQLPATGCWRCGTPTAHELGACARCVAWLRGEADDPLEYVTRAAGRAVPAPRFDASRVDVYVNGELVGHADGFDTRDGGYCAPFPVLRNGDVLTFELNTDDDG